MKCKIFEGNARSIESSLRKWLESNNNVIIQNVVQSQSEGRNGAHVVLTIVYSEDKTSY